MDCQRQLSGWDQNLALPFTFCMTVNKALNHSEPQLAHLQNEDSIKGCLKEEQIKASDNDFQSST